MKITRKLAKGLLATALCLAGIVVSTHIPAKTEITGNPVVLEQKRCYELYQGNGKNKAQSLQKVSNLPKGILKLIPEDGKPHAEVRYNMYGCPVDAKIHAKSLDEVRYQSLGNGGFMSYFKDVDSQELSDFLHDLRKMQEINRLMKQPASAFIRQYISGLHSSQ